MTKSRKPPGTISIGEAARRLCAHPFTLHRWSQQGILPVAYRGLNGKRFYREKDVRLLKKKLAKKGKGDAA